MDEQTLEVLFPTNGIDSASGYGTQRPNTAVSAVNVRSYDPFEERNRGGSRHGLVKYPAQQIPEGSHLIQHMNQLVVLTEDYLLAAFDFYTPDMIADYSTNNNGTRNPPGRLFPPFGSGVQPSRLIPVLNRRRLQVVAVPTMQYNGNAVTLNSTLTGLPAAVGVAGLVTLRTIPAGQDGDGDTVTTSGGGTGSFSVNEATYEGRIIYITYHEYTNAITGRQNTVTGFAIVNWKPRTSLRLESPLGYVFIVGIGSVIGGIQASTSDNCLGTIFVGGPNPVPLMATLNDPVDDSPVVGKTVTITGLEYPPDQVGGPAVPTTPFSAATDGSGEMEWTAWGGTTKVDYTYVMTASATINGVTITSEITVQRVLNAVFFVPAPDHLEYTFRSPPPTPGD